MKLTLRLALKFFCCAKFCLVHGDHKRRPCILHPDRYCNTFTFNSAALIDVNVTMLQLFSLEVYPHSHHKWISRTVPLKFIECLRDAWVCLVLLMEEILHHLGCIKPCKLNNGINYQPPLVRRISSINSITDYHLVVLSPKSKPRLLCVLGVRCMAC